MLNRPGGGGGAPSPVETRAIYTFIYWRVGGRAWGEPAGWPSFAEIKSLSLRLGKSQAWVPVCAHGGPGMGRGAAGGGGGGRGGGRRGPP